MALHGWLKTFKTHPGLTVKGQSMIAARKDGIDIIAFEQRCTAPRDSASGQATGRRQYSPVSFTSIVDAAYPNLLQILDENQAIVDLEFLFYMPREAGKVTHQGGKEFLALEYKFTTCHIASLEVRMLNVLNPELQKYEMTYTATFVFEQIECNYKNNASTSMKAAWSIVNV
jgi:type VI secretion system Hcp family effector